MSLYRALKESTEWFTGPESDKDVDARTKWLGRPWGSRGVNWTHGGIPVKECVMKRKCKVCAASMRRGEF